MRRGAEMLAVLALVWVSCAAPASAATIHLGHGPVTAPTCPQSPSNANCTIILTWATAVNTDTNGVSFPTLVERPGRLTSFTVGLSKLSSDPHVATGDRIMLDSRYGGFPRVAITVLRPVGGEWLQHWRVSAESRPVDVEMDLGRVLRVRLGKPLAVLPGDIVALTTTTWAPVLAINLNPTRYSYEQSRATNCLTAGQAYYAQKPGDVAAYRCRYVATEVEYSATEQATLATNLLHPFQLRAALTPVANRPDELNLDKLSIDGIDTSTQVSGGCMSCSLSSGTFTYGRQRHATRTFQPSQPIVVTAQTQILQATSSPGPTAIGRFKLYGVSLGTRRLVLKATGCLPPGVRIRHEDAAHLDGLRQVPCSRRRL